MRQWWSFHWGDVVLALMVVATPLVLVLAVQRIY